MSRLFNPYNRPNKPIPPGPQQLNKGHPLARNLRHMWVTLPGWQWDTCHVTGNKIVLSGVLPSLDHRGIGTDANVSNLFYMPLNMNLVAPFTMQIVYRAISGIHWSALDQGNSNWDGYYQGASVSNNTFDGSFNGNSPGSTALDEHASSSTVFTIRGTNDGAGANWGGHVVTDTAFTMPLATTISQIWFGAAERQGYDNLGVGYTKMVGVWDRAFSDQELRSLARNPWQLFQPSASINTNIFFPTVAGAPTTARSFGYVIT